MGHISGLEAGPLTKIGQNDRNVEPVHHVKFGEDSWPYKIGTAPNVPDLPGAVASKPLEMTGTAWHQIVARHKLMKLYICQLFDKHIGKIATDQKRF